MNETLVKYLAGLLDADGTFGFTFKQTDDRVGRYYLGVRMGLSSSLAVDKEAFVDSLPDQTGFGAVFKDGRNEQFRVWTVSKRAHVEMLIPRLVKHMVIKGKHWQWVLETWRSYRSNNMTCSTEERDAFVIACKESRVNNSGPIRPKNHPTWAWLAGYLDGDGWYSHRHIKRGDGYAQWVINVGAVAHVNDIGVLQFISKSLGGYIFNQGQSDNVFCWRLNLGKQNRSAALALLPNLVKHSRLKRKKIEAIIHHHQQRLSVSGVNRTFCTVEGCGKPSHGHGMCSMHYQRKRKEERRKR